MGGGAVSTVVIGWGYNASKLIKQVEDATGEKAAWLPFLWEHVIRFVTPAILWVLFFYLFAKDVMATYGGYPRGPCSRSGGSPPSSSPSSSSGCPRSVCTSSTWTKSQTTSRRARPSTHNAVTM